MHAKSIAAGTAAGTLALAIVIFWGLDRLAEPSGDAGIHQPRALATTGAELTTGGTPSAADSARELVAGAAPDGGGLRIVGTVSNEAGIAIPSATVRVMMFTPGEVELCESTSVSTGRNGSFVLPAVPQGCIVEASAAGFYAQRKVGRPGVKLEFLLGQPGAVEGHVREAMSGAPCAKAIVVLYPWRATDSLHDRVHPRAHLSAMTPLASARTRSDGSYALTAVPPARFNVVVFSNGHSPNYDPRRTIQVVAGDVTTLDIFIGSGYRIVGHVSDAITGDPISGARVEYPQLPGRSTVTDASGAYELSGFEFNAPGRIYVKAPGYLPATASAVLLTNDAREHLVRDVRLRRGAVVSGRVLLHDGSPLADASVSSSSEVWRIPERQSEQARNWNVTTTDASGRFQLHVQPGRVNVFAAKLGQPSDVAGTFTLHNGETIDVELRLPRGGSILGHVRNSEGKPIAAVQVALFRSRDCLVKTFSQADGSFATGRVRAGTYEIEVLPPGIVDGRSSKLRSLVIGSVSVQDDQVTAVEAVLELGVVLAGTIVDERGKSVSGAVVKVSPSYPGHVLARLIDRPFRYRIEHARVTRSNENGKFEVHGLDPGGQKHDVSVCADGYEASTLRGVEASRRDLRVTLRSIRTIDGTVRLASSREPVAEFGIDVYRTGKDEQDVKIRKQMLGTWRGVRRFFVDAQGRFRLELAPGNYEFVAHARSAGTSDPVSVHVPATGRAEPVALLVRNAETSIVGAVRDTHGAAASKCHLHLYEVAGTHPKLIRRLAADLRGQFEIGSVAPGRYVLHAMHTDPDRGEGLLELGVTNATHRVSVTLETGSQIRIRVVDSRHDSVAGASVTVERKDGMPVAMRLSTAKVDWGLHPFRLARQGRGMDPGTLKRKRRRALDWLRRTDEQGTLGTLHLLSGEYTLRVTGRGYADAESRVAVARACTREILITLRDRQKTGRRP